MYYITKTSKTIVMVMTEMMMVVMIITIMLVTNKQSIVN